MAKAASIDGEGAIPVGAALEPPSPSDSTLTLPSPAKERARGIVTILYSQGRELYRVLSIDKPCWLSVTAYELPATRLGVDAIYLGPAISADGKHWRKAFSTNWRSIVGGDRVAIPSDDPMVKDYEAYECAAR